MESEVCSISHGQTTGANSIQFKLKQVKNMSKTCNICGYFLTKLSDHFCPSMPCVGLLQISPCSSLSTIDVPCLCFVVKRFHMKMPRRYSGNGLFVIACVNI